MQGAGRGSKEKKEKEGDFCWDNICIAPMGAALVAAPGAVLCQPTAVLGMLSSPSGICPNSQYENIIFPSIPSQLSPHHG